MKRFDPRALPYALLRRFHLNPHLHWLAALLVNHHFLLGVAGVILDEQGRVLLFRHTYRRSTPWGLPGGWMVRGESPLEAIEREVREESSLAIRGEELLMVGTTRDRAKLEFVVRASLAGGTFRPSREVDDYKWATLDQLPPLPTFHYTILQQLATRAPGSISWYHAPWVTKRGEGRGARGEEGS
jgi:8-oxo-dGTP diphosphatase